MRLYNSLTRAEEEFAPADGRTVRMYTCGLTAYARGHIGNFRTFVSLDLLRRALRHQEGYAMHHVMNFTDVDDKTIRASREAGVSLREYTDRYIAAFYEDARALGLEPVEDNPRATDEANLRAMVEMVQALEARGHTYASDGSIYFKISTWPGYGNSRSSTRRASRPARAWTLTRTRRRTLATSSCGRPPSRASRPGTTGADPA